MNPRALLAGIVLFTSASFGAEPDLKIGIIGLDSSHCVRFARLFNDTTDKEHLPGARIVWAYRGGSPDVDLSRSRVEGFTAEMRDKYGVTLLDSIADLSARSDAILMLSLDGRVHLAEARIVFPTGKPVFIDKPLAGSYADSVAIARLARELNVPLFSSSPRRIAPGIAKLRQQNPVDFTSGQGVEIARKNHRLSRGDAPITKQLGRMEASFGLDGFVGEVRIEKGELPPGHMAHPRPIHGIGFVDAPRTRRRDIGRLRQPEGRTLEDFDRVAPIVNGGEFLFVVRIPPDPEAGVFRQCVVEKLQLLHDRFLQAGHVGRFGANQVCHKLAAVLPAVEAIGGLRIADVE